MSINVYSFDNSSIAPLEVTKEEKVQHIDLLYYKNHYCWIKDLRRLVGLQVTKRRKNTLCKMCLNSFLSEENLNNHKNYCREHKSVKIEMLKSYDNILQFEHYNNSLNVPFLIYADFEYMLQKIQTYQSSDETSYINAYQNIFLIILRII
jgi:hypothetical protein